LPDTYENSHIAFFHEIARQIDSGIGEGIEDKLKKQIGSDRAGYFLALDTKDLIKELKIVFGEEFSGASVATSEQLWILEQLILEEELGGNGFCLWLV